MSVKAYIGLGGNLGDREATIRTALTLLGGYDGVQVTAVSELIETAAVGGPVGQGAFLNGAAALETTLSPRELLTTLLEIEQLLGRVRQERWGPRTIDLDLLLYGDQVIEDDDLIVPHPQMNERRFVLAPLSEIAADAVHPVSGRTVAELLASLGEPLGLIAVSGIVGVGKTTLARHLARLLEGTVIEEEYDKNPFLPRQLAGDTEAALASELDFLLGRARQLDAERIARVGTAVADYWFEKNRLFAALTLSDEQLRLYDRVEAPVRRMIAPPCVVVFLHDSTSNCLDRIHQRGRPYEQRISANWLAKLEQAYEDLLSDWSDCPVCRIDCSSRDMRREKTAEEIAEMVRDVLPPVGCSW